MFQRQLGLTGRESCKESIDKRRRRRRRRRRRALKEPETGNTETVRLMSGGQSKEPINQFLK